MNKARDVSMRISSVKNGYIMHITEEEGEDYSTESWILPTKAKALKLVKEWFALAERVNKKDEA